MYACQRPVKASKFSKLASFLPRSWTIIVLQSGSWEHGVNNYTSKRLVNKTSGTRTGMGTGPSSTYDIEGTSDDFVGLSTNDMGSLSRVL